MCSAKSDEQVSMHIQAESILSATRPTVLDTVNSFGAKFHLSSAFFFFFFLNKRTIAILPDALYQLSLHIYSCYGNTKHRSNQ